MGELRKDTGQTDEDTKGGKDAATPQHPRFHPRRIVFVKCNPTCKFHRVPCWIRRSFRTPSLHRLLAGGRLSSPRVWSQGLSGRQRGFSHREQSGLLVDVLPTEREQVAASMAREHQSHRRLWKHRQRRCGSAAWLIVNAHSRRTRTSPWVGRRREWVLAQMAWAPRLLLHLSRKDVAVTCVM